MKGIVYYGDLKAGEIEQTDDGYVYRYYSDYLERKDVRPVSHTLPLQTEAFRSNVLFPFFDGLIPEGWLLDVAVETWKINPKDRMKLLLHVCKDCIGAVKVIAHEE